ncbi:hypothetical protein BHE74_00033391 [Ensete ventricosum]|nr:hypothetical protein BHE74_00033391 [Ensete ventricosum]
MPVSCGPDKWGSLRSEFKLCSAGKHQSPINIVKDDVVYNPNLKALDGDYVPTNATFVGNGFNVEVCSSIDETSACNERHTHVRTQMVQLHLVHSIAVVSILYRYGHPDAFLLQVREMSEEQANKRTE